MCAMKEQMESNTLAYLKLMQKYSKNIFVLF